MQGSYRARQHPSPAKARPLLLMCASALGFTKLPRRPRLNKTSVEKKTSRRGVLPVRLAGSKHIANCAFVRPCLRACVRLNVCVSVCVRWCRYMVATFAMSINVPSRAAVLHWARGREFRKLDGSEVRWIRTGEYIQMAGRSGRRNCDTHGRVVSIMAQRSTAGDII